MRVLWIYNSITADFADFFEVKKTNAAGWITGMLQAVCHIQDIELSLCFPIRTSVKIKEGMYREIPCYSLFVGKGELESENIIHDALRILHIVNPDIVQIWGTEYAFSLDVMEACRVFGKARSLIHLQGCIDAMMHALDKGVPEEVLTQKKGKDSIKDNQNEWMENVKREREMLKLSRYVCGRTAWDRAYVYQVNRDIHYYHCDELFRDAFYQEMRRWDLERCEKHRIYVSQGFYPLKGLHFLIQALPYVVERYSDVRVFVGGNNSFIQEDADGEISSYGQYIMRLLRETEMEDRVAFLGLLDEEHVIEEMLNANIMVSPSVIENSQNSICEAMYLGMPIVASFVGGVPSLLNDRKTALMYSYDDVRMLAGLICEMFDSEELQKNLSRNALRVASERHDPERVGKALVDIYHDIINRELKKEE